MINNVKYLVTSINSAGSSSHSQQKNWHRLYILKAYHAYCGPGYRIRYRDSLRRGQSGDRIPVDARLSAPVRTGTGAHPALFPGGKAARVVAFNYPPPSRDEVKERVELYLYSPCWSSWSVLGWSLPFTIPITRTGTSDKALWSDNASRVLWTEL